MYSRQALFENHLLVVNHNLESSTCIQVDDPDEAVKHIGGHAQVTLPVADGQRDTRLRERLGMRVDACTGHDRQREQQPQPQQPRQQKATGVLSGKPQLF